MPRQSTFPAFVRERFRLRFSQIVIAIKNRDNREREVFDNHDYMQYHDGMIATVRALSGRNPRHFVTLARRPNVKITLELLNELTTKEEMMWVVGGGDVVSENHSHGIRQPEIHDGWATIEADNWHFHLRMEDVDGIQFVVAISHGDLKAYYVRFSRNWEETLVRCYFPNPLLDENEERTEFQPEKLQAFEEMRDRWVGREGIVFVER